VTGEEYVVPFDAGCQPEAAVSGAILLQDEYRCFLVFNVSTSDPDVTEGTRAIVGFHRVRLTKFGFPNDEAKAGHPLYGRGFGEFGYDVSEVLNSSWAREAEAQNKVRFPDEPAWRTRHFMFAFHDSCFECLADSLTLRLTQEPWSLISARLMANL
jgi:hypothetical protein